ncbi:MAG TPA: hypothetical protein VII29_01095, partial [Terriglobales bacterium]
PWKSLRDSHIPTAPTAARLVQYKSGKELSSAIPSGLLQAHSSIGKDFQRSAPESQLAYCQRAVCVPIELPTIGRAPLPYSQTPNSQCLNHSTIRLETSNLPEGKIEGS